MGYCATPNLNFTRITTTQNLITSMELNTLTNQTLQSIAVDAANQAHNYLFSSQFLANKTALSVFMTTFLPQYNATVRNVTGFLANAPNLNLSTQLTNIRAELSVVQTASGNQSVIKSTSQLQGLLGQLQTAYRSANLNFTIISGLVRNNTITIIYKELEFRHVPPGLSALADQQGSVNIKVASGIHNTSEQAGLIAELQSIGKNLSGYSAPLVTGATASKMLSGPLVTPILAALNMPVGSKIAAAPMFAAIIALVIGLVIIAVFYLLTYARVKQRKGHHLHHRVHNAWRALFVVLFVLLAIYVYLTYTYAANATQFLPISGFLNAVKSNHDVIVATDNVPTLSWQQSNCEYAVNSALRSLQKNISNVQMNNYTCLGNSYSDCYDMVLNSGLPAVVFQGFNVTTYNGIYGTQLNAGGSLAEGSNCELAQLIKSKG